MQIETSFANRTMWRCFGMLVIELPSVRFLVDFWIVAEIIVRAPKMVMAFINTVMLSPEKNANETHVVAKKEKLYISRRLFIELPNSYLQHISLISV